MAGVQKLNNSYLHVQKLTLNVSSLRNFSTMESNTDGLRQRKTILRKNKDAKGVQRKTTRFGFQIMGFKASDLKICVFVFKHLTFLGQFTTVVFG